MLSTYLLNPIRTILIAGSIPTNGNIVTIKTIPFKDVTTKPFMGFFQANQLSPETLGRLKQERKLTQPENFHNLIKVKL